MFLKFLLVLFASRSFPTYLPTYLCDLDTHVSRCYTLISLFDAGRSRCKQVRGLAVFLPQCSRYLFARCGLSAFVIRGRTLQFECILNEARLMVC